MSLEYVNYILWVSEESESFIFYPYIQADTWKFKWSLTPDI
jgi:hypothetical protein